MKTYPRNAGHCERCGYYKTWGFRVQNPKSGKMMPGHVNEDGFKINNGDCPYWANLRNQKRSNYNSTQKPVTDVKKVNSSQIAFSRQNGSVILTLSGPQPVSVTMDKDELLRVLLDAFTTLMRGG
ncbi:MAG: hypothetical protein ACFFCS_12765 [Candidatus Hodarchaeota archaeon]